MLGGSTVSTFTTRSLIYSISVTVVSHTYLVLCTYSPLRIFEPCILEAQCSCLPNDIELLWWIGDVMQVPFV
jgi:hypothetical protein